VIESETKPREDLRAARFEAIFRATYPRVLAYSLLTRRVEDPSLGGGAFPASVKTLDLAAEILQNPLAGPQLRAALYDAEGMIPGVERQIAGGAP
jgi:hypothetical protein